VCSFDEFVNINTDSIVTFDLDNYIYRNIFPRLIRHLVKHKWSKMLLWETFHLLPHTTIHNIFLDKYYHFQLLVISTDQFISFLFLTS